MQIKVLITENEFLTGDLLKEKKPPVGVLHNEKNQTTNLYINFAVVVLLSVWV